jgi:hypothetical protein
MIILTPWKFDTAVRINKNGLFEAIEQNRLLIQINGLQLYGLNYDT